MLACVWAGGVSGRVASRPFVFRIDSKFVRSGSVLAILLPTSSSVRERQSRSKEDVSDLRIMKSSEASGLAAHNLSRKEVTGNKTQEAQCLLLIRPLPRSVYSPVKWWTWSWSQSSIKTSGVKKSQMCSAGGIWAAHANKDGLHTGS